MPINQPSNQIKLTNVSLVRMRKGKKRFEIACYKNKVLEWRSGVEKHLDNVLQTEQVFLNVSKGQLAPKADLEKAFGKEKTTQQIIIEILRQGELQVGEKERNAELERTRNEVIDIVAGMLVDPRTKRVYTTGMIEKALDQLSSQSKNPQADKSDVTGHENGEEKGKGQELPRWTGVVTSKSAKSQALFASKALVAHQPIPVARMQMKLRVTCPTSVLKQAVKSAPKAPGAAGGEEKAHGTVKDTILGYIENVESQDVVGAEWEAVGLVDPGAFKALNELIEGHTKGRGNVEVLEMAVKADD